MSITIFCSGFGFDIRKEKYGFNVRYRPASRFDNDSPIDSWIPAAVLEKGGCGWFLQSNRKTGSGHRRKTGSTEDCKEAASLRLAVGGAGIKINTYWLISVVPNDNHS